MDLETFIEETITQILTGIKSVQSNHNSESDGAVVPEYPLTPDNGHGRLSIIDFDVAVTITGESGVSGGLKVLGMGASGESSESLTTVSRIKFKIPVALPFYYKQE